MTKNEFKQGDNMTPKFTTPCFIHKNTPELRKKLEKLGYIKAFTFDKEDEWLICNILSIDNVVISGEYDGFGEGYIDYDEKPEDYGIDCGENEQLFLALAALREDSHKYQWHICTHDHITHQMNEYHKGDWNMCVHSQLSSNSCWRKATPAELIEHFNKN